MVSPDQSRRTLKKERVCTPPDVRTEMSPVGLVTTGHWCPWGEQYQESWITGIHIAYG